MGAVLHHLPVGHDHDALAEDQRVGVVVRDQQGGDGQIGQHGAQLVRAPPRASARPARPAARPAAGRAAPAPGRGPAPRAAAARPRGAPGRSAASAADTQPLQHRGHAAPPLGPPARAARQAVGHVLGHAQVGEQRVLLEDQADVAPARRQVVAARRVVEERRAQADRAGVRRAPARRPAAAAVLLPAPLGPTSAVTPGPKPRSTSAYARRRLLTAITSIGSPGMS